MKQIRLASLQSFFLPWIGVFNQVYEVDIFAIADNLQYEKKSWINRNRIKNINGGFLWLTVPIKKSNINTKINEIKIDNSQEWKKKHLKSIEFNYKSAPYFNKYFPLIKSIYEKNYVYLIDLNYEFFKFFIELLELNKTKIIYESNYRLPKEKNEAIIELCKQNNVDIYFSGQAAKCYLDYKKFEESQIKIEFQNYRDIEYQQVGSNWIPKLSILDTLFMVGAEGCKKILKEINEEVLI